MKYQQALPSLSREEHCRRKNITGTAERLSVVYIHKGVKHSAVLADNIQQIPYVQH